MHKNHEGYQDPTSGQAIRNATLTENEKKKEYLKSYRAAVKREADILKEIQRLRADKMFPSVVNDGLPKGSYQNDLSEYAAILDEQIQLLKEERLQKVKWYKKIESRIRAVADDKEKEVLRLRYIRGFDWNKVAEEMGYSWKGIHNIHGKALNNFSILEKST